MITRVQLSALIAIAFVLWYVLLIVNGLTPSIEWFKPYSMVIGLLGIILIVFERWAWKLPILHDWFVPRPNLSGTWEVTLQSGWGDKKGKQRASPIHGYMTVRQTYSTLSMHLMTEESSSEFIASSVVRSDDGTYQVAALYRNTPKVLIQDRSRIHHGGMLLRVLGNPPYSLEGYYWTDRDTQGEMRLSNRRTQLFWDLQSAQSQHSGSTSC